MKKKSVGLRVIPSPSSLLPLSTTTTIGRVEGGRHSKDTLLASAPSRPPPLTATFWAISLLPPLPPLPPRTLVLSSLLPSQRKKRDAPCNRWRTNEHHHYRHALLLPPADNNTPMLKRQKERPSSSNRRGNNCAPPIVPPSPSLLISPLLMPPSH